MGNVGLTQALADMQTKATLPRFNQVVLAAPDIDADIFKLRIAPRIVDKAERCTLYTSKNDLALIASRYFNSGPRLGETLIEEGTYPGLDVIDASAVDTSLLGHSYYGNASLISDIRELLHNRAVDQRRLVRLARGNGHPRWFLEARGLADEDEPTESARSTTPELR
jgi:esterase/lipase superfamily enzyme